MLNFAETLKQLQDPKCSLCGKKSTLSLLQKDNLCMGCLMDIFENPIYIKKEGLNG